MTTPQNTTPPHATPLDTNPLESNRRNTTSTGSGIVESHTELAVKIPDHVNVTDGVLARHEADPSAPVYAVRNGTGGWIDISIGTFLTTVRQVAKGLIGVGVRPGDRVAVMAPTSYRWAVMDQAIWFAGGVSVPIYETASASQVAHVLGDSGARLVFVGDESLRDQVRAAADQAQLASVQIFSLARPGHLDDIAGGAEGVTDESLESARSNAGADGLATLVYTSGTTGKPKAVRITHRNLAEGAANILPAAHAILGEQESRTLLFLPLAHVLARAVQLTCLHRGIQVAHSSDTSTLLADLGSFRPTWLLVVPRVLEKVYHSSAAKAHATGKGRIFEAAKQTAIAFSQATQAAAAGDGEGPSLSLRMRRAVCDRLVYSKLRAALGGEVTHVVSGASALNAEIAHFFTGIGLPVQEGYGLTESTAPITLNVPGATRIGSVGLPIPGHTVRIAPDGEILLKGPVVFDGYDGQQEATDAAFDADGFFRSGDLGELDGEGYLRVTGRKKDIIVTAGGKNVSPAPLEEAVRSHRLVGQAVVVGENRPYVGALISLDAEAAAHWAQQHDSGGISVDREVSVEQLLRNQTLAEAIHAEIQSAVEAANLTVSRAESIRKFQVLPVELTEASGHLTPSMKLKRSAVMDDFAQTVEELYSA